MAISGYKSLTSLAIYQRVKSDEKLMMGMSLTYSLFRPEEVQRMKALNKNPEDEDQPAIENQPQLALPAPNGTNIQAKTAPVQQFPEVNQLTAIPQPHTLDTALVPMQPAQQEDQDPNFDLVEILADFQNDHDNEDLVLGATQYEALVENGATAIATNTTSKTIISKKIPSPKKQTPTFNTCRFGSIGTINIHIHKH